MEKPVTIVPFYENEKDLADDLKKARSAGYINRGEKRVSPVKKILDAIVGRPCDWNASQCERLLRVILKTYVKHNAKHDRLELLIAICGLDDEYKKYDVITDRRIEYAKAHPEHKKGEVIIVEPRTLEKREEKALKLVAKDMITSYTQDRSSLIRLVVKTLDFTELEALGLTSLIPSETDGEYESLRITDRITNLDLSLEPGFIGRTEELEKIYAAFNSGEHIVVVESPSALGKSRLCLEYARLHQDEYQIIYWLDASSKDHLNIAALDFSMLPNVDRARYATRKKFTDIPSFFQAVFDANQNYLLIMDNANLGSTYELDALKRFLPSSGHTIITTRASNFNSDYKKVFIGGYFDNMDNLSVPDGAVDFVKQRLGIDSVDDTCKKLISYCFADPFNLVLVTSLIKSYDCIDISTCFNMLKFNGFFREKFSLPPSIIVFSMLAGRLGNLSHYYSDDTWDRGIIELLVLLTTFTTIDLNFFGNVLSIFPESLASLVVTERARKLFIKELSVFSLFEAIPGVVQSNQSIQAIANFYFPAFTKKEVLSDVLHRARECRDCLEDNPYLNIYPIRFKLWMIISRLDQTIKLLDKPTTDKPTFSQDAAKLRGSL